MRVLILHNRYQFAGGEDVVVQQESAMLREAGIGVELFEVNNDSIVGPLEQMRAAVGTLYSWKMRSKVSEIIRRFRPDIMHVHNFMPRLSPSIYDAAHEYGCAVVQTLHNYRLICANAQLFRENKPCQDCVGRSYGWPGVVHRCYRGSAMGSGVIAGMTALHRVRGTWRTRVHRYIVLTKFAQDLMVRSGAIPAERISIKPNAVEDIGVGSGDGNYLLYVGRLSSEKGIQVLLEAAHTGAGLGLPLKIAGAGPLEEEVRAAVSHGKIEYLGKQSKAEVGNLMHHATALLFPSICYETFGLSIVEAFSAGLPVVASGLGAMAEVIQHEKNGLSVKPGSVQEFQAAVRRLMRSEELRDKFRRNGREIYEEKYTKSISTLILLEIYKQAKSLAALSSTSLSE